MGWSLDTGTVLSDLDLMAVKANTWYELALAVDGYGGMRLTVWEKNDPTQMKQVVEIYPAGTWANKSWAFMAQVHTGVADVDWYRELDDGGVGQPTGMTDASGSTSWRYDAAGRPNREEKIITGGGTFVSRWGYNAGGQLTWMLYPGASPEMVTYGYHPQMALNSVLGSSVYVQSARYDAAGRLTQVARGAGTLTSAYTYYGWTESALVQDEAVFQGGRLKQVSTGSVQNLSYLYDRAGNVVRILDAVNSNQKQCFQYDVLDRLTLATTNEYAGLGCTAQVGNGVYSQSSSYDANSGNLASKSGLGAYSYQDGGHKHAVTHLDGTTPDKQKYWYDANGNMTRRIVGENTFDYYYDAENRLVQVNKNSQLLMSVVYDGDGQRVKTTLEGTPNDTVTAFVGSHYEVETVGSTSATRSYYYAGSRRVALRLNTDVYYLLGDHPSLRSGQVLGSTSVSYKAGGSDTMTSLYTAWGEGRGSGAALPTKYAFTGQYSNEGEFGLLYYGARWYDKRLLGSLGYLTAAGCEVDGLASPS